MRVFTGFHQPLFPFLELSFEILHLFGPNNLLFYSPGFASDQIWNEWNSKVLIQYAKVPLEFHPFHKVNPCQTHPKKITEPLDAKGFFLQEKLPLICCQTQVIMNVKTRDASAS